MLSAKDLLENETLNNVVDKILINKQFVDECVDKIKNDILKDNKIDSNDIPALIYIVTLLLNNKPEIKINQETMTEVLKLLIVKLLVKVDYIKLQDEIPLIPEQEKLIDMSLQLLGTTLIVIKKWCKCL